ncbi:MAG: PAS domain S-box protein [Candidatus Hydrogenedentes bacterium]|nr:PAS domain S-box protein [Candidatus Hydrogenedentota bacterium]
MSTLRTDSVPTPESEGPGPLSAAAEALATGHGGSRSLAEDSEKAALQARLERLRLLLGSIDDLVFVLDGGGRFTDCFPNESADRDFSAAQFLGKRYDEAFPAEVAESLSRVLTGVRSDGIPRTFTYALPMPDGMRWFTAQVQQIPGLDGATPAFLILARNTSEQKRTQDALDAQGALLKRLAERVPGVLYQYRHFPDGRACFPYASEGIREIYEVSPEEVVADASLVMSRLHEDDRSKVIASVRRSFHALEPWSHEFRVRLPKRGVRWLRGSSTPERLEDGSVLWHGCILDITESKESEDELRRHRAELKTVYDNAPVMMCVVDPGHRVLYGNRAFLRLAGDSDRSVEGMLLGELLGCCHTGQFNSASEFGEACRGCGLRQALADTFATERTHENIEFRTTMPGREGEHIFLIAAAPIRTADGIRVLVCIEDVTKRTQVERALQESEAMFRALHERAGVGIAITDLTGALLTANVKLGEIMGYPVEELLGTRSAQFTHPDDIPASLQLYRETVEGVRDGDRIEKRYIQKSGSIVWAQVTLSTIHDVQGNPSLLIAVVEDITQRKQTADVQNARIRLSEFALTHSLEDLLKAALDEMEALTQSSIGFWHTLDKDQRTLHLQTWSTNTVAVSCRAKGKDRHYDIDEAGVWVDCVHQHKPVIHNDYASLPHRKGTPEGHAPLVRELTVPVLRGDLVVAIIGVGNKPVDYDARDIHVVSLLADLAYDIAERKRAEEAVAAWALRNQTILDTAADGIHVLDEDGCFIEVNAALCSMLGYSRDELLHLNIFEVDRRWPAGELRERIARMPIGSNVFETKHCRKDGEILDVEISATRLFLDGKPYVYASSRDITERKHAELLAAVMNRILAAFTSNDGESVYADVLAILREVTGSRYGVLGYIDDAGRLVCPSLTREIWMDRSIPGERVVFTPEQWAGLWGRSLTERTPSYANEGLRVPEGHVVLDNAAAIPLLHGVDLLGLLMLANKPGGFMTHDIDMLKAIGARISPVLHARRQRDREQAARERALQDLGESEERFLGAFEHSAIGKALLSPGGNLFKVNHALSAVLGYSEAELVKRNIHELLHPQDVDGYLLPANALLEEPSAGFHMERRFLHRSGSIVWAMLSVSLVRNESGAPLYLIAEFEDITERKRADAARERAEAELRQAQKMELVGRLAGGVAHDFNNMLSVILGYADQALSGISPVDPLYQDLGEIRRAAERSANLTRQLLAFSRKQVITPAIVNLNQLVENHQKMLLRLIGESIDLKFEPAAGLWPIKADPAQVDQILANLAVNARDAISGQGTVTIATANAYLNESSAHKYSGAHPGEYVMLCVSDTGYGMDAETQERIFEPFFTTKELGKGTGLGLSTVYGIVQQNKGFIHVQSRKDAGTAIAVYFPRHEGESSSPVLAEPSPALPGHETILVVEDEAQLLQLTTHLLKKLGYRVLPARSPDEACEIAQSAGDFHLLLTDVVMPSMNGKELRRRIEGIRPGIKSLFMSGYTADAITDQGILEPGSNFIPKPFTMAELGAKIREVLGL